jgi:uncharacterized protein (TIGR03000 family)
VPLSNHNLDPCKEFNTLESTTMLTNTLRRVQVLLLGLLWIAPTSFAGAVEEAAPTDRAPLIVRVPAGAALTIESEATHQTGTERRFVSPILSPGQKFVYTLRATWQQGGKEQKAERKATVQAGQITRIDLTTSESAPKESQVKTRNFLFTYGATVTGLSPGKVARIWVPVPPSNDEQDVEIVSQDLPAEGKISRERKFGNEILYVETKANAEGRVPLSVTYRVTRRELKGDSKKLPENSTQLAMLLQPDSKVPTSGKPLELIKDKQLPSEQMDAAHVLYEVVNGHMRYSKEGTGWGNGDSVWACESGYGNCTDFHSLFISLARANKIPAKFEIGFPLPAARGAGEIPGYHCWAKFKPEGHNWVPVDISEANKNPKMKDYYFGNLTEDRVTFSTGRDLELVPKQAGKPLNFFVYPYVEVDGKIYPADKVQRKFSHKDVAAANGNNSRSR